MFLLQDVPSKRWILLQIPTTWWCYRKANVMITTLVQFRSFQKIYTTNQRQLKVQLCWGNDGPEKLRVIVMLPMFSKTALVFMMTCFPAQLRWQNAFCNLSSCMCHLIFPLSLCQTTYRFLPILWRLSTTAAWTSLSAARSSTLMRPSANTTVSNPILVPPSWPLIVTSMWLTHTWSETN